MGRTQSANLTTIFQAYRVRHTVDLYLNDGTVKYLSRGAVSREIDEKTETYNNYIKQVGDLNYSIENAVERIRIDCQNENSELGLDLASDVRLLDYALADYGKVYESERTPGLIEDIPQVFRGVVADAELDETNFRFEIIVDYESLGSVIAARGLSPRCWWLYQNGIECTSSSGLTSCPKTRQGCRDRHEGGGDVEEDAEHGGWQYFEEPSISPPSGGGIGGGPCFTGDVRVWTPDGDIPIGEMKARVADGKRSVYSFDFITGRIIEDEIVNVWEHQTVGYFTLDFGDIYLNVTPLHNLLNDFGTWKNADDYQLNDAIKFYLKKDRVYKDLRLKKIKWNSDVPITAWNLQVRKNKTYFANGCAVSNLKPVDPDQF